MNASAVTKAKLFLRKKIWEKDMFLLQHFKFDVNYLKAFFLYNLESYKNRTRTFSFLLHGTQLPFSFIFIFYIDHVQHLTCLLVGRWRKIDIGSSNIWCQPVLATFSDIGFVLAAILSWYCSNVLQYWFSAVILVLMMFSIFKPCFFSFSIGNSPWSGQI